MINGHLFLCSLGGLLCEVGVLHYAGIEHGDLQQLVVVVVHHAAHRTDAVINQKAFFFDRSLSISAVDPVRFHRIRIRIQSFYDQKFTKKNTAEKFCVFF